MGFSKGLAEGCGEREPRMVLACLPCVPGRLEMQQKRQKCGEGQVGGGGGKTRDLAWPHTEVSDAL